MAWECDGACCPTNDICPYRERLGSNAPHPQYVIIFDDMAIGPFDFEEQAIAYAKTLTRVWKVRPMVAVSNQF